MKAENLSKKQIEIIVKMRDNPLLFIEQRVEIPKGKFSPTVYTYLTEGATVTDKRISKKIATELYEMGLLIINSQGLDLKLNPLHNQFISELKGKDKE